MEGDRKVTARRLLETIGQDARHFLRSLRGDPGVVVFAVSIIGLGIAASSTVFSVGHALFLRPLPFADPGRLVWISNGDWGRGQRLSELSVQVAHLQDLRAESRLLDGVAGYSLFDGAGDHTLTGAGEPERVTRLRVTGGFFGLLGVRPRFGRLFTPEELAWGGPRAVLLLHGFWQRRFGGDPDVVGRAITIDGAPAAVVGVLPASFDFNTIFAPGNRVDYVAPFPLSPETNRRGNTLALVGRLRRGATLDGVRREARAIAARPRAEERNRFDPFVSRLREHVSRGFRAATLILAGAVGLLMLIVCTNLSNLLLARGAARRREIAVRSALGAGRRRLIRQMLTESLLLSLAGAGLGLLLTMAGTRMLARMQGSVPLLAYVRVDGAVLAFTLVTAVLAGIAFGVVPALRASALRPRDTLKAGGRGSATGRRGTRTRGMLVVSEVALTCLLLVGAGLLIRSFVHVLDLDLGFDARRTVALRIDPSTPFPTAADRESYYAEALRRVRAAPGLQAAGLVDVLPTAFNRRWCVRTPGGPMRDDVPCPYIRVVSEGYLRAMGISLPGGRDFTTSDDAAADAVVIVNDVLADALWPGESAIGRTVRVSGRTRRVVGVVRGTRYVAPEQPPGPELFLPIRQVTDHGAAHVIVRGDRPEEALAAAVGSALRPLDARLPVQDVVAIQDLIDRSISPRRLAVTLMVAFAAFALVLAALGIYGVVSYSVRRRRAEIAVRMALGAAPAEVRRRILIETFGLGTAGVILGLPAAWMLARAVQRLLFGVATADPVTFATVPALLLIVVGLAGYLPAARAARLDPVTVLGPDG